MGLVSEAVVRLRDDFKEVEIFTSEGKLRPAAVNLDWQDQVRMRSQPAFLRSLDRNFLAPSPSKPIEVSDTQNDIPD
jgi:hypothetical protein